MACRCQSHPIALVDRARTYTVCISCLQFAGVRGKANQRERNIARELKSIALAVRNLKHRLDRSGNAFAVDPPPTKRVALLSTSLSVRVMTQDEKNAFYNHEAEVDHYVNLRAFHLAAKNKDDADDAESYPIAWFRCNERLLILMNGEPGVHGGCIQVEGTKWALTPKEKDRVRFFPFVTDLAGCWAMFPE